MNDETELKELTDEQIALLKKPLPEEAVKPHPTKSYLSSIKAIYVVERLNDVFGTGKWSYREQVVKEVPRGNNIMVVMRVEMYIPEYNLVIPPTYGGNDNDDLGDAYKGAITDAITKIGSFLGIGMDVYKGLTDRTSPAHTAIPNPVRVPGEGTAAARVQPQDYAKHFADNPRTPKTKDSRCDDCNSVTSKWSAKSSSWYCSAFCFKPENQHLRDKWSEEKTRMKHGIAPNIMTIDEEPPMPSEDIPF